LETSRFLPESAGIAKPVTGAAAFEGVNPGAKERAGQVCPPWGAIARAIVGPTWPRWNALAALVGLDSTPNGL